MKNELMKEFADKFRESIAKKGIPVTFQEDLYNIGEIGGKKWIVGGAAGGKGQPRFPGALALALVQLAAFSKARQTEETRDRKNCLTEMQMHPIETHSFSTVFLSCGFRR